MNKLDKTFKINPIYEADSYKMAHHQMMAEDPLSRKIHSRKSFK